ncbi:hypothetical protein BDV96DRAFT_642390 [Lophiotrema nucula]|uniref:Uncharacterized protein n=1 Tax=Lophiotrema nucula TaxID=690887 RepID=A0A6A5ZM91_9PLEO|nr:hypothetical protein BDV96DRAFT_642390 [Lophiotrema nucula]
MPPRSSSIRSYSLASSEGNPSTVSKADDAEAPKAKARYSGPVGNGERNAEFRDSRYNWTGKYHETIDTATKKIVFGGYFVLQDDHIDDILALGPKVCEKLTNIIFHYGNVNYSDASRSAGPKFTDAALDALGADTDWVPNLKKLILPQGENSKFMKSMQELTKEREDVTVTLIKRDEEKKWGDWELTTSKKNYKFGRKQTNLRKPKMANGSSKNPNHKSWFWYGGEGYW